MRLRFGLYLGNQVSDFQTVLTSTQSVWVSRPTRSYLGAIRARLGPFGGAWQKLCGFEATIIQSEYEMIGFRTAFSFVSRPSNMAQKQVCIQNLRKDLSFQEKKTK